jgi:4-amino-4-deoxy-L-arabinose transferase
MAVQWPWTSEKEVSILSALMIIPVDLPGGNIPAKAAIPWYRNPAVLIPGGLLLLYLILYILPLGYRPLIIPYETRYAEIPREMLATGDWMTPHLVGLRYFEKPPLGYWFNALSIAAFGENEFAVRLPGALAAGLTSLIVFLFTLHVWKNRRIALSAALIHLTCLEVYVVGTFNVLDNLVTLFLTAGIYAYYLAASKAQEMSTNWKLWTLSGIMFGLAFLAKGFLAFAVPVLVLVPWMLLKGNWRILIKTSWWVILAAVLIALPWAVIIHLREGDFWRYFFWIEHIKRFSSGNTQHTQPFYYFLMYLPALAFPWLSLIPATLSGLRDTEVSEKRGALRFLWLWLLLPFIFFSASSGKLVTYILPCFPPFAVLMAVGLTEYFKRGRAKLFNFGILLNALIFLCLFAGLFISQTFDIGFHVYDENERAKFILATTLLFLGAAAGLTAVLATRFNIKLASSLALIVLPLFASSFVVPNVISMRKSPGQQLMQYRDRVTDETIIISDHSMMHSVGWYLKRDDIYLISRGEARYGLEYPDARHRLLDLERLKSLLKHGAPMRSILIICRGECPGKVTALLPAASKHTSGAFTFWFMPAEATSDQTSGAVR